FILSHLHTETELQAEDRHTQLSHSVAGIQWPDGLLIYANTVSTALTEACNTALEQSHTGPGDAPTVEILVFGDIVYGSCCVEDVQAKSIGCSSFVHFGHSRVAPEVVIPTMHIPVTRRVDTLAFSKVVREAIEPCRMALLTSAQYVPQIQELADHLTGLGYEVTLPRSPPLAAGECLGCTIPPISDVECALVLLDGRFHAEGVAVSTGGRIPVYLLCPNQKKVTLLDYNVKKKLRTRLQMLESVLAAPTLGVLLGVLGRQGSLKTADAVCKEATLRGQHFVRICADDVTDDLLASGVADAWVAVACPRLSLDWGEFSPVPVVSAFEYITLGRPEEDEKELPKDEADEEGATEGCVGCRAPAVVQEEKVSVPIGQTDIEDIDYELGKYSAARAGCEWCFYYGVSGNAEAKESDEAEEEDRNIPEARDDPSPEWWHEMQQEGERRQQISAEGVRGKEGWGSNTYDKGEMRGEKEGERVVERDIDAMRWRTLLNVLKAAVTKKRGEIDVRYEREGFGELGCRVLSRSLQSISLSLVRLDLIACDIGERGAIQLAKGLPYVANLRRLFLPENNLGVLGVTALAEALPSLDRLEQLNLYSNDIGDLGIQAMQSAMSKMLSLLDIDLGRNNIGTAGFTTIAKTLGSLPNLARFHLSENHLGREGVAILGKALSRLPNLEVLTLQETGLDAECVSMLKGPLTAISLTLRSLDLSGNDIGTKGGVALAGYLPGLLQLERLVLNDCNLGGGGVGAVARALPELKCLSHLSLGLNHMGVQGVGELVSGLVGVRKTLTELILFGNNLQRLGIETLGAALSTLRQLHWLDLGDNALGREGLTVLCPLLSRLTGLTTLSLSRNNIDPLGSCQLAKCLTCQEYPLLADLDISYNPLGEIGGTVVLPALHGLGLHTLYTAQCGVSMQLERYLERAGVTPLASNTCRVLMVKVAGAPTIGRRGRGDGVPEDEERERGKEFTEEWLDEETVSAALSQTSSLSHPSTTNTASGESTIPPVYIDLLKQHIRTERRRLEDEGEVNSALLRALTFLHLAFLPLPLPSSYATIAHTLPDCLKKVLGWKREQAGTWKGILYQALGGGGSSVVMREGVLKFINNTEAILI
ncbi:diphthamide synthesis DPH1/DPH2, partial [Kipferlia bialata]